MYQASIENRGDTRYFATTRNYQFILDTEGKGANPIDTLLAGLAACVGHHLRDFLRDEHIASRGFAVRAESRLTEDRTRLADIALFIDLKGAKVEGEKEAELLARVGRCPIYGTLANNSKLTVVLEGLAAQ